MLCVLLPFALVGVGSTEVALSNVSSLESIVALATAQVQQKYGKEFGLIEVLACKQFQCARGDDSMKSTADAGFIRATYTPPHKTTPNVAAYINITGSQPAISFEYHAKDPFIGDEPTKGFPPASMVTFESAWSMLDQKGLNVGVTQVTWRHPVEPCCSEDLFMFNLDRVVPGHSKIISVGTESKKACFGFVTNQVPLPFCKGKEYKPDCLSNASVTSEPISV